MKLATLKDGTRDGQLVVVSRDLHTAVIADAIAPTLQRVIEDWSFHAPQLRALYDALNTGRARRAFNFETKDCMAPLPRAYRMIAHATGPATAGSSAAANVDTAVAVSGPGAASASRAPTTDAPQSAMPLVARRADALLGPRDDVVIDAADAGLVCDVGLAAILGDLPPGSAPARAADRLHLLMLASAFASPAGAPGRGGPDLLRHHDYCAFSPVAVTPDEFGAAWRGVRLETSPEVHRNGRRVAPRAGAANAGGVTDQAGGSADQADGSASQAGGSADFSQLAAALARTQGVAAGTIVFSATVRGVAGSGKETDAMEDAAAAAMPGVLEIGDRIRVDSLDAAGASVCGAIDHSIALADDSM